jgi:hypothetical protein
MSKWSSKRQRTGQLPSFGAPDAVSDSTSIQQNVPSSSASSTRSLPIFTVPALTTLCGRVFAANFVKLRNNNKIWERKISDDLRAIPDSLIPKLFAMLRASCPTYLKHEFIVTVGNFKLPFDSQKFILCFIQYLLRGSSVTLRGDLPGVNRATISDIARINPGIQELELSGFEKITDSVFASLLRQLPSLRLLVLR